MVLLALLELKTLSFNNSSKWQAVTNCHVGELLKGEILGSSNAKNTNNLHGRVSEGSHVRD